MKLIFATKNAGKVKEFNEMINDPNLEIVSLTDAGVSEDIVEDGKTFAENALKKARFAAEKTGEWAIGDDSGLCIDALNGQPGIHSARWGDGETPHDRLFEYALNQLINVPVGERSAHFECVVALVSSDGQEWTFDGRVDGEIVEQAKGDPRPGLPYDLIFAPADYETTFAEMTDEEKNALSHRGLAVKKLKQFIKLKNLYENKS
ncbi:MAG TPA: RdgB/HAM1 family non-canonical purine NTP pyrophosphatase [Candidatus Bipolaricaulota bacterium]|nr:RdgB/HAM1 family non-canonical purine NTP pyrophosphatase [Candidatus Bipolaricaulota bacterium]